MLIKVEVKVGNGCGHGISGGSNISDGGANSGGGNGDNSDVRGKCCW